MPGFDGTGPNGEGPLTGRGFGYCEGNIRGGRGFRRNPVRGSFAGRGMRRGIGRGIGRGIRAGFADPYSYAPGQSDYREPTKEEEIRYLEEDAKMIESEQQSLNKDLEEIRKRLEELKNS